MAQLKDCNPQVQVLPVRGNVETRLAKAESDEYDGVILAAAGLVRLGLAERVSEYLSVEQFVPPPGQGVLAVEMRVDDDRMREILARVDHSASRSAAIAERGFLELLGGGCQLPVGAYAQRLTSTSQEPAYPVAGRAGVGGPAGAAGSQRRAGQSLVLLPSPAAGGSPHRHQQPSSRGPAQGLQPPGAGVAGTG